ncbi:GEVED domain-containing protein [Streptococcus mitis]|uniref:Gram-positive signal peptide protein, YSIRK family n=1 Tax=Streptococcus mitis ATCC 6249 TaxID=864567 RepID=E0PS09_STRMT|nr:GEVED domain-containing protein [Streptococcus mitis]EFM31223.1 Gram-positive signal peptide protein, YSIRK family [Streptococcus mitis ATCC 6249]
MGKDLFNSHFHKFSIRKLNVGVCSVLLSTLVLLGVTSQVSADETSVTNSLNEVAKTNLDKTTGTSISPTDSKTSEKSETPSVVESSQPTKETATSNSGTEPADKKNNDQSVISETSQSPVEKPVTSPEDKSRESAKPETAAAPIIAEPTETSSATEQSTRSRRVRRDTQATTVAPASYAGADDATPVPRTSKPELSESEKKESTQLAKQINWIDFSDTASLKNLDPQGGFKIGTTYTKEISPGYVVTLTVTELKPFQSTEIYKKRVEGTSSAGTYDPNATNNYLKNWKDYGKTPPPVSGQAQDKWSTIGGQGFDTKGHKTQIIVPVDGVNWGVKFKIEATYRGKKVKPAVVMADGEDANPGEYGIFTTNGEGWEYVGEWMKGPRAKGPYTVTTEELVKQADKTTRGGLLILKDKTVDWNKFLSPDTVTGGLGSQVFGPIVSASKAVPVVMTRGASEVGFYVATAGQQALMMGFLVVDGGDAPESYGEAHHTISTRDSITNVQINQPYLGSTEADIDVDSKNNWTSDDREDVSDEGSQQLLTADQYSNTNDLLDLNKAKNGTYTLKIKANPNGNAKAYVKAWVDFNNNGKFDDNEGSVVKEITANGDHTLTFNAIPSLSGGLVDQLGMRVRIATNAGDIEKPTGMAFSGEVEDMLVRRTYPPQGEKKETTGLQGETQNATVHFTPKGPDRSDFVTNASMSSQAPQILDNQGNVLTPTNGNTYVRPEGTYVVTTNGDDIDVAFTPNADFTGTAEGINIRRTDSNGSSTNWQSTDASNPNKNDILNNMDGRYIPTVRKIPTYESTGVQGQEQNKNLIFNDGDSAKTPVTPDASRPATFVNANGQPITGNSVPATSNGQSVGTYELDPNTGQVTFKPNKNFVGTPDPVTVQVNDSNGVPYRAHYNPTVTKVTPTGTNATSTGPQGVPQTGTPTFQGGDPLVPIDETVEPTFADGSKEKSIPGQGTYTIAPDGTVTFTPDKQFVGKPDPITVKRVDKNGTPVTATYSPEFTKVTPTGTGDKTEGLQGQVQEGKVTFTPGHDSVPFPADSTPLFDNGTTVKELPNVGKFEVDADGKVTFTPDKQFKGETPELELTRVDANGTPVTVKYQAVVKEVVPTGTNATSTGPQGVPQTGTPSFQGGDPLVPIDETVEPTFADGSKEKVIPGQGTYTIAPDGTVTFIPDKQFVGKPDPVTVKRVDKNGTPVIATYSPEFTKVTPTGTGATSTGPQGVPQTGTPTFQGGDPLVPIDETVEPTFADGSKEKVIPGQGTYTIAPDGTVTFIPDKQFVGSPVPVTVKRVDKNGTPVTATYSPEFTKVTPTGIGATSTGPQGLPQTGTPSFQGGDPLVPIDETVEPTFADGSKEKSISGQGTYTIAPDGTVTFTPDKQFVGSPDPITVKRVDKNGTPVTATYSPEFTKVTPTGTGDKTEGLQGQVQEGKVTFTPGHDSVPFPADSTPLFDNGTTVKEVPNVGKFEVDADGKVSFTPDKQFKGETPELELTRVDANGTPVTVKYQAVVKEVVPTSTDATSNGIQGQPQKGTPTFTEGNPLVPIDDTKPMTFEDGQSTKIVSGVGEYSINPDGSITFTPEKQYVGTPDPVTVKRVDKNGTPVTATYTPTVTKVTPTSTNATSTGPQGVPQTGTPTFQGGNPLVPIDETVEPVFEDGSKEKTIPGQGTYTIAPDGTVTFTPDKQFVGNPDPVTVKRVDKNGTPVTATYSPEFTKVTPTGTGATSTGPQGLPQTGTPTFQGGDPLVPIDETVEPTFEDGSKEKSIPGQGTYTIAPDGTVTFIPDKQFVGSPVPVTVKRVDKNGTPVTATYSPEFTKVTPTGTGDKTEGLQGQVQEGKVSFTPGHDSVSFPADSTPLFDNGTAVKEVPNVGKFEVDADGKVTFTPDKQFKGETPELELTRVDANGTPVTVKYQAVVKEVTPTGTNATSSGPQGVPQTGTPSFQGGDPLVPIDETVEPTFEDGSKEKSIPGQGTYTIAPDGTVTFTPDKQFVGKADPVTVKRVDKNGTPVTATYTPTVTKVTPTSTNATSTGPQGVPQTGTPTFQGGDPLVPIDETVEPTFADGSKEKVIPGQGTYTIAPDGTVTFIPDKQFVGKPDPVTVKRVDKNGTPVTATYSPEFTKVTPTGTGATSTGPQGVPQTGTPTFQGGDPLVPIDETVEPTFADGSKEKVIPGQGTYTIAPDGTVTFIPDKQFVGKPDPVTVKRVDKNGTPVTATYSPEFTKVTPTGKDTSSVNIKGVPQTGTPTFQGGDPLVPINETVEPTFEDESTEKVIPGEGTYVISPDGTVTFTPEANFVGKGTGVTIVRKDKNGTPVTASYRPTVVDPSTGHDTTSTGAKGRPQVATPTFEGHINPTVPPTFEDGSTTMVVPGEGSYTIDKDGKITFTPEADFVGTAKGLVVKRLDMYGNVVTAHYTPTVLGQTQVSDATSEGLKGQTQTGKPNFTGDVDLTVPPTFEDGTTEKVVPGEGTYVISPDGTVTFTPEADFVGQAKGVKVIRKDRNGNILSGFYTPTVVELPVVKNPEQQGITEERTTKTLPNTGSEETSHLTAGLLAALSGMGLISLAQRKKSEEE